MATPYHYWTTSSDTTYTTHIYDSSSDIYSASHDPMWPYKSGEELEEVALEEKAPDDWWRQSEGEIHLTGPTVEEELDDRLEDNMLKLPDLLRLSDLPSHDHGATAVTGKPLTYVRYDSDGVNAAAVPRLNIDEVVQELNESKRNIEFLNNEVHRLHEMIRVLEGQIRSNA